MMAMKNLAVLVVVALGLVAFAGNAVAQDYSKGSNAKTFGLSGEQKATFSGKVVDIHCELSGDCPANCGGGNRTLGIVRASDNALVMVSKSAQFEFNGAADDLLPYCNKNVDVDGLLIGDDPGVKSKIYMVQLIRETGQTDWEMAELWTDAWKKRNPDSSGEGPWYRRDERVAKQLKKEGYLGLGLDVDKKWIAENQ